jgi:hypothetical protein
MAAEHHCIEVKRSGGAYYLLDTKGYEETDGSGYNPLLAVLPEGDYRDRLEEVTANGDATAMFDSPEQHRTLNPGELHAFVAYAAAGRLALEDGASVIARERMQDLTPQEQLIYSVHSV